MSRRVATIGDRRPVRTAWADLADSSQDCSRDVPPPPLVDESKSYDTPAAGVENSKDGLNSRLAMTVLKQGPIDFTFLINDAGKNGSIAEDYASTDASAASSSAHPTSSALQSRSLNPSATSFVPMASHNELRVQPSSPDMPPPAVPQMVSGSGQKSRRIRGKRPASSAVQAPAVKRTREQDRETPTQAAQIQQRVSPPAEPIPPATEEEWQHRIGKRVKVVTAIKDMHEYQAYIALRPYEERLDREPQTPTAEDRNLSKRRWEYEIQQWRTQLKQWAADNAPNGDVDAMQLDEAGLNATGRGSCSEDEDDAP